MYRELETINDGVGTVGIYASEAAFRTGQGAISRFAFAIPSGADPFALAQTADENAPLVPQSVTMRQARLALLGAGKLAMVDAAIDSMPEPNKSAARIEWEYSNEVQRHNGFVEALGPALGMTSAQIDALFIAAAKL